MMRNLTLRGICLALVLALLLSMTACVQPAQPSTPPATSTPTTVPTVPTTVPTVPTTVPTEPTTVPTEPPTEPTEPLDPKLPVFEMTQEDVDEFYRLLQECETMAIAGEDLDAIDAISDTLDEQMEYLQAQNSIAYVLYFSDMENEKLVQQHQDCVDILTAVSDDYLKSVQRIYLSDTPAKDMLFEDWTDEDIRMLLAYEERISELQNRNSDIEVEYEAAKDDATKISLYVELIQNNNEIAQIYGYANYYEYAYAVVYERDYDHDQIVKMREYAKNHLTKAFDGAVRNFNKSFYGLKPFEQNTVVSFLDYDYNLHSTDYLAQYLEAMPQGLQDHMAEMLENDSYFATKDTAMAGAFTISFGDRSFCFYGPGYKNCTTVIHEGGHYYASRYADLNAIPMDLAETHSQGNEWLFIASLADNMSKNPYNALVDYLLYNNITMTFICLMVDEFEERVYTTDVSNFTATDFNGIMVDVASQYFTMEYINSNMTDVNAYWRMVVVDQPVYYISYAVSACAALDLYKTSIDDFAGAAEIYRKLCEEPVLEEGFLANISSAGLMGPFEEEFYIELNAMVQGRRKK